MTRFDLDTAPVSVFLDAVKRHRGREAACAFGPEGGIERISYAALHDDALARAASLAARFEPGARIALSAANTIEHLAAWLAIQLAGLVWVPINPNAGAAANAHALALAEPGLVIADEKTACALSVEGDLERLEDHPGAAHGFTPRLRSGEDTMAVKFTGGSTGAPKGVVQSCRAVAANMINMAERFAFDAGDVFLASAPLTHGSSHFVLPVLAAGGRLVLTAGADPDRLVDVMAMEGVTSGFMPPTLISRIAERAAARGESFPALKRLIYGAAPFPEPALQRAQTILGPRIAGLYGQTEAPMTITTIDETTLAAPGMANCVGTPAPLSEVTIVGPDGGALAPGEEGEIAVSGPLLMDGYLDQPDKTAETIREGRLMTGDVGRLDETGRLWITGRASDMLISGGFNIHPAEVEAALSALDEVAEACAFGAPDADWGERLEALIVPADGAAPDLARLRAAVRERLGPVKTPKAFHIVDALPRNSLGKVVRAEIREQYAGAAP